MFIMYYSTYNYQHVLHLTFDVVVPFCESYTFVEVRAISPICTSDSDGEQTWSHIESFQE
jgi:hypothetical protein